MSSDRCNHKMCQGFTCFWLSHPRLNRWILRLHKNWCEVYNMLNDNCCH